MWVDYEDKIIELLQTEQDLLDIQKKISHQLEQVRWELSEFCEERDRELPIWKVENDQGEAVALDLLHEDAKEHFNAIDPSEWNDEEMEPEYFVYKQDLQGPHHRYSLAMAA
jgi:hypothetical protein